MAPQQANAHAPGENYVWVNIDNDGVSGRFEIHIKDLKNKLNIDWEKVGGTKVEAVAATRNTVQEYLLEHFQIIVDGKPIELTFTETNVFNENGNYAQYYYEAKADVPDKITIRNDIFITSEEPLHRSLIVLEYNKNLDADYGGENAIMAFGPYNSEQVLDLNDLPALLKPRQFVWQGILHIWIGLDHILFLVALLLLAVVIVGPATSAAALTEPSDPNEAPDETSAHVPSPSRLIPVDTFGKALWNVLKIVTIFTLSHSITLSLAALKIVELSPRIVESLIALSIVLVGLNNIFLKFNDKRWVVIFVFGLFHGMGFASVMGVLPFRTIQLTKVLLAFNIGVELGQIAIVAGIFPVLYLIRRTSWYRPVVVIGGSIVISAIAFWWFIERAFEL